MSACVAFLAESKVVDATRSARKSLKTLTGEIKIQAADVFGRLDCFRTLANSLKYLFRKRQGKGLPAEMVKGNENSPDRRLEQFGLFSWKGFS